VNHLHGCERFHRQSDRLPAGVSDHVWTMEEIAALMEAEYTPKLRGPYKKKIQTENSK
jgi:hypothetical protein